MANTYSNLLFHVVFSTKQRYGFITESLETELYRYMAGIIKDEGGVLLRINGTSDHVHLLLRLKPTQSLADVIRKLKAGSSKWVNETQDSFRKFGWQDGYSAFSVSESQVEKVKQYIANQKEHHRLWDWKTELRTLLEKHNIGFHEKYFCEDEGTEDKKEKAMGEG